MLAKQVWRLLPTPNSLVGRVLKARYFKNDSVMEARRGYDPSFSWGSMWGSKSLLATGRAKVESRERAKHRGVCEAWLPGENAGKVPMPNVEADPNMKVSDFIDVDNERWNIEVLCEVMTEDDVKLVLKLPLSKRMPIDEIYWWRTKDGKYTVKFGYWVERRNATTPRESGDSLCSWKQILPVRKSLFRRHCCLSPLCNFCHEEECSDPALFGCAWMKIHWKASGLGEFVEAAPHESCEERITWILHKLRYDERGRFLDIVCSMWTIRNQRLFEESPPNENVVCSGLVKMVADYYADRVIARCMFNEVGRSAWSPPLAGIIKINTDAYMAGNGSVGLGAVALDKDGRILWMGSRRVGAEWDVEVAEAQSAIFGLDIAREKGLSGIALECDALNLVRAVRDKDIARTPVGLCVEDLCTLLSSFESNNCYHVKCGGNTVAHCLTRICERVGDAIIIVTDFPQVVISLAEIDLI
ncbi:uncharacterized protein LOC141617111 [Silene latifolia]|uniref:uncharacterized protein LOC141617111 n=1 Tax=Silene latifolia TaxID=37657 RepID=UPI003D770B5F